MLNVCADCRKKYKALMLYTVGILALICGATLSQAIDSDLPFSFGAAAAIVLCWPLIKIACFNKQHIH